LVCVAALQTPIELAHILDFSILRLSSIKLGIVISFVRVLEHNQDPMGLVMLL
jgi:hypothetical protein